MLPIMDGNFFQSGTREQLAVDDCDWGRWGRSVKNALVQLRSFGQPQRIVTVDAFKANWQGLMYIRCT